MSIKLNTIITIMVIITILLTSKFSIVALADDNINFDMNEISTSELSDNLINSLYLSEKETTGKNVRNFDISLDGNILLSMSDNSINVYDNSLNFMYSLKFNTNGSSIAFWYNNMVAIYLDKSDTIICLNKNGDIINAYHVENTIENSKMYRNLEKSTIETGRHTYKLSFSSSFQRICSPDYTMLIRINKENNTKEVVYENDSASYNIIVVIVAFTLLILIISLAVYIKFVKYHH